MAHRVEISASAGTNVATRMSEMRAWLDDRRFEPNLFNYNASIAGLVFQVDFDVASEAMAFAQAFRGQVLS